MSDLEKNLVQSTTETLNQRGDHPVTEFPDEEILPDDYPVYGNYLYVADGRVIMSGWHGVTVRYMKAKEGFKEVRRCNMIARGFR